MPDTKTGAGRQMENPADSRHNLADTRDTDMRQARRASGETDDIRLKRLKMQSWRRGTREMDLILGPFADTQLATLSEADLRIYDDLLGENDQDLYRWVTRQGQSPPVFAALISLIAAACSSVRV